MSDQLCDCGWREAAQKLQAEIDTLRGHRAELKARLAALSSAPPDLDTVLEALHQDVLARWRTMLTPALNNPTSTDLLNLMGHVNEAFSAAKDAAVAPAPPVAETPEVLAPSGYQSPMQRHYETPEFKAAWAAGQAERDTVAASPVVAPAPQTPDVVDGQCPRCGERDGAHAADCLHWTCDHCGHDREAHRDGAASRLERDGRFHPCGAGASPAPERCGYVHADGWTCGRAKGHPSVHVPPSRMANPPVPVVAPAPVAARLIRNRLVAIRDAAENPPRDFNLGWQLGRVIDEIETVFSLGGSANLAALSPRETAPAPVECDICHEVAPRRTLGCIGCECPPDPTGGGR